MKLTYPGLTEQEVRASREAHGSNTVTTQEVESFWDKLLNNVRDPIILILCVALAITVVLAVLGFTSWYEGLGIAIALALAILVATWSEYRNENAFQKLLDEASMIEVKTFRNNILEKIGINKLVVGDFVLLKPGDMVPADGLLVAGRLELNQAPLTGESEPVKKYAVLDEAQAHDDTNAISRASVVEDGEAVMRITAVGDQTQYGKTIKEVVTAEDRLSPLQEKLKILGRQISTFGYIGAVFIALSFMFDHIFLESDGMTAYLALPVGDIVHHVVTAVILAIIIIVVAVPEGLPMMIAVVLSLNMRKLLKAKVLVRKLLGIETAGSLTVLFCDKTGTLTRGKLMVADFFTGDLIHHKHLNNIPDPIKSFLAFSLRHNTSAVVDTSDPNHPRFLGANPTEQALLHFVSPLLATEEEIDIVDMITFSSYRKFSAVQVTGKRSLTLVKGAAEILLSACTHYLNTKGEKVPLENTETLNVEIAALSKRAMRLLAVAVTDTPIREDLAMPQPLALVGIFGLRDELREESSEAVQTAKDAGIHVVMITGDSKETARTIAKDVGLLGEKRAKVITSTELEELSDEELKTLLPDLYVVARAFPTDKSRLVKAAKELGWVVGMTGDGVNDAPAVKNADVGFAMGSGTEMTKESSDIVILDDNFTSLTRAVLYGRTLFKSIRKFLVFQLSVNIAAIMVAFLGPFFGYDLPLTMTQLLWINLIIDTLAALAFAGEAALDRTLLEKPIPKDAPLITRDMWVAILIQGISMAVLSLIFLTTPVIRQLFRDEEAVLLSAFFAFFVFTNNFNKFNARTESLNLFDHLFENKGFIWVTGLIFALQVVFTYYGGNVLRTVALTLWEWGYITLFSLVIIPIDLLRKIIWKGFSK